jgi:pilus assembly protein Flp/PilA
MATRLESLWRRIEVMFSDEEGASAVEYGVMVALIIGVLVAIVGALGSQVQALMCSPIGELIGVGAAQDPGVCN